MWTKTFTCLFTLHLATCSYLLDPFMHFPLLSWLVFSQEENIIGIHPFPERQEDTNQTKRIPCLLTESTDPQRKKDRRQKRISDHCGATLIIKQWFIKKNLFQVKTNRTSFINFLICYKQKVKTQRVYGLWSWFSKSSVFSKRVSEPVLKAKQW